MIWRLEHKYLGTTTFSTIARPTRDKHIATENAPAERKKLPENIERKIALAKHSVRLDKTETRMECWQSARARAQRQSEMASVRQKQRPPKKSKSAA